MNPPNPHSKKEKCEKMRNNWLLCRKKYKVASTFSKGTSSCNSKFKEYLNNCGDKEEEKMLRYSIYATH
uniref:Uncharacterized protein n=1 Tax=viral metagenome TaxID=1070528 RepID=A0A6C0JBN6_9ZZZZ|tara:strand:+ start:6991 stop:7197 length:207 start_codon:yes stop_codon:yes gene_type:complete